MCQSAPSTQNAFKASTFFDERDLFLDQLDTSCDRIVIVGDNNFYYEDLIKSYVI